MKLEYVKFFQAVQAQGATGWNTATYMDSKHYDLTVEGQLIRAHALNSPHVTYVTLNNVCFMRALNDDTKTKNARGTGKTQSEG